LCLGQVRASDHIRDKSCLVSVFVKNVRFCVNLDLQTGPGVHPASYTMGTGSLSRG
jgi:hypothetical protein